LQQRVENVTNTLNSEKEQQQKLSNLNDSLLHRQQSLRSDKEEQLLREQKDLDDLAAREAQLREELHDLR
jgi:hypothetical protein